MLASKPIRTVLGLLCLLAFGGCNGAYNAGTSQTPSLTPSLAPSPFSGFFTMTNEASGNRVIAYSRASDGTLTQAGSFATGGLGVGHGLENQGALAITDDRKHLLVVNPGSDDVSAFQITTQGLQLVSRASSGGRFPVSVTEHAGVVYVLNRGSEVSDPNGDSISGLILSAQGQLNPILYSTNTLTNPSGRSAQIGFSPNGTVVAVTEQAGIIDTYVVDTNGVAGGHLANQSAGQRPFALAFRSASELLVAEADGTASSYLVSNQGTLQTVSAAISTQGAASCWIVVTPDKSSAYVANTASATISAFVIAADGSIALRANGITATQSRPLDLAISSDGQYLNVLTTSGNIEVYRIDSATASLTRIQVITGLPPGTNGLAAL